MTHSRSPTVRCGAKDGDDAHGEEFKLSTKGAPNWRSSHEWTYFRQGAPSLSAFTQAKTAGARAQRVLHSGSSAETGRSSHSATTQTGEPSGISSAMGPWRTGYPNFVEMNTSSAV